MTKGGRGCRWERAPAGKARTLQKGKDKYLTVVEAWKQVEVEVELGGVKGWWVWGARGDQVHHLERGSQECCRL